MCATCVPPLLAKLDMPLQAYGINTCQMPGLFSRSDPNATGLMTPAQIGECFVVVGVYLSKRELDRVAKWGETEHKDQIEYPRESISRQWLLLTATKLRECMCHSSSCNTGVLAVQSVSCISLCIICKQYCIRYTCL